MKIFLARGRSVARLLMVWAVATAVAMAVIASPAQADEWKTYESKKYGFSMKIPKEFKLQDEKKGATWIYQPGSAESDKTTGKKKKFKVGLRVKGVSLGHETSEEESSSSSGGGTESAMTMYVNWTWMPDVSSGSLYDANVKSVKKDIESPDPKYTDLTVFSKKEGYACEGNAFWYKEAKKQDFDEIHRWHIGAYGNKSSYIVGLCGTYRQFDDWGDVYEKVLKSFKLIPLEKE